MTQQEQEPQKKHKSYSLIWQKMRELQAANPMDVISKLENARVWEMAGSVELNAARVLGTNVHKLRTMRAASKDLDEVIAAMESAKSADVLAKMELGEINTKVADRLIFTNLREVIEAPKLAKQEAPTQGEIIEVADIQGLLALEGRADEQGTGEV